MVVGVAVIFADGGELRLRPYLFPHQENDIFQAVVLQCIIVKDEDLLVPEKKRNITDHVVGVVLVLEVVHLPNGQ